MRATIGGTILIVGVLIMLLGFAVPATTTQTARTCYDDPFSYGQSCSQTTYESPNTGKVGLIFFGVLAAISGGFYAVSGRDLSGDSDASTNSDTRGQSLGEQIREKRRSREGDDNLDSGIRERDH